MASIRKYTTPTHTIIIDNISLSGCEVYVAYRQGDVVVVFDNPALDIQDSEDGGTVISVTMSQDQSGMFDESNYVEVQVNWVMDGKRNATDIAKIKVDRNLIDEVIS